jgi:hypothetical protein
MPKSLDNIEQFIKSPVSSMVIDACDALIKEYDGYLGEPSLNQRQKYNKLEFSYYDVWAKVKGVLSDIRNWSEYELQEIELDIMGNTTNPDIVKTTKLIKERLREKLGSQDGVSPSA